MRLHILILISLLFKGLMSEDVEVVEAISTPEELNEINKLAQNREDSDSNPDQIALESGDQDASKQNNNYNPPSRNHLLPGRINQNPHIGISLPHSIKPYIPHHSINYDGPPPPLPPSTKQAMDKYDFWSAPVPDMPKIISLDVKCEKNSMKIYLGFDKPFYGIVFSKGHYSNLNCVHLPAGLGRTSANFEISIHNCGTSGNTENGLYGYGSDSGSGTYFENIIVVQYDPQVQEIWDQARKLRCTWHDQYEKSVTFRPFPVDMLDVVRADFAGDNVGCWMQIQVGKGPWASEVSGLVKIGQTMTMVLAIKDDDSKFDMLVRNCMAHDGKRAPIQLVDQKGCVTRSKLMSRFTKIKNFGASASVLSYAHFQAFKFPDSMEVHFQCTIQICRYQCPDQCSSEPPADNHYGPLSPPPLNLEGFKFGQLPRPRDERLLRKSRAVQPEKEVGVNKIIKVVSTGDLTFALDDSPNNTAPMMVFPAREDVALICMTTLGFAATLVVLLAILVISCLLSAFLCVRLKPFSTKSDKNLGAGCSNPVLSSTAKEFFVNGTTTIS